jgi:amino acid adenylation domain-containing protein
VCRIEVRFEHQFTTCPILEERDGIMRRSLDVFFSESARKYPTRPALFINGKSWSYRDLNAERDAIERTLYVAGIGGRRCNVGLVYARSMFTYASIIAIMRSNNVYVPLNGKLPAERLVKIIEDAQLDSIIIDASDGLSSGVMDGLRQCKSVRIIATEGSSSEWVIKETPQHNLWHVSPSASEMSHVCDQPEEPPLDARSLAYIIYTSGSTGVPKGVAIAHDSACSCIERSHQLFETCEKDRFTQFSALSFDVSILDLFLCWKSGGALYVPAASEALVPLNFAVAQAITVWSSVPSLANVMLKLRLLKSNALPRIRLVLFCGEALPCELAEACLSAAPSSRVFNLYGPTECTIFATYHEYKSRGGPSHGTVPIGVPLSGLSCMIVNDGCPVKGNDVPGELWISGDQLATGYWNNAAATAAAFVQYPVDHDQGTVWYRTGDLVSCKRDVGLEFRGRLDRQVKLRGHRIELQEIESVLRNVIGCTLVAIVPVRNAGGICEQIIAYCDKLSGDEATIKELCLSHIPRYMVPDRILELDNFPLSSSGKIDYLALAAQMTQRLQ